MPLDSRKKVARYARHTAPFVVNAATPDLPNSVVISGTPPGPHKTSHEPGGSDALTLLANSSIAAGAGIVESKLSLNFPTHSNANDPTAEEKAALPGTSGTPGAGNKYVTDADPRNTNARTPTAHASTHEAGSSDPLAGPIDFPEESPAPGSPAANTARVYAEDYNGLTLLRIKEAGGRVVDVGHATYVWVRNNSGLSISKGVVVRWVGGTSSQPTIIEASRSSASFRSAAGILMETIPHGSDGWMCAQGILTGVDTSSFSLGSWLYLASTPGEMTTTQPTFPAIAQRVALPLFIHASNGILLVSIEAPTRVGDGIASDVVRIGNDTDIATQPTLRFHRAAAKRGDLRWGSLTTDRTIDLPDVNDTLLGIAQAITIAANARVNVRKNSGADVGTRRRLNFIEGSNVTLTVADDAGAEEVDITIAAAGGSGSATATTVNVSTPTHNASVTVVDAAVSPTSKIILGWGNCAQSDANHPGMGQVSFNAVPGTGQFTVEIFSLDESKVFGDFKLLYQVL